MYGLNYITTQTEENHFLKQWMQYVLATIEGHV